MKILITESQYRRLLNKKYLNEQPKGFPNTQPTFAGTGLFEPKYEYPQNNFGSQTSGQKNFSEPLGNPKKQVWVKDKFIPPQNNTHYWDGSTWVEKSVQNVDKWRSVPSGFVPEEYNEYLNKLQEINKIYPENSKLSFNSAESTGVKVSPTSAKQQAINQLKSIYYNKNYPLGITNAKKQELSSKLNTVNKYYENQLKQLYGNSNINRGDFSATMHSQQIKGGVLQIQKERQEAVKSIESQYNYWKQVKEEKGFDWITVIGFALYLCPYTAAFAPYFTAAQGLTKAGMAYDNGNMKEAGLETLFALLPLGSVGKTVKSVNVLNAVDKLITNQALNTAEIGALNTLSSNSTIIKTEMKNIATSLLDKVPETAKEETKKWVEAIMNKAYKEGEKQLSAYEDIKQKLISGGKKQGLEKKVA